MPLCQHCSMKQVEGRVIVLKRREDRNYRGDRVFIPVFGIRQESFRKEAFMNRREADSWNTRNLSDVFEEFEGQTVKITIEPLDSSEDKQRADLIKKKLEEQEIERVKAYYRGKRY